mgnify:CR=1 FL=1
MIGALGKGMLTIADGPEMPSVDDFLPDPFVFQGTPFAINRIILVRILATVIMLLVLGITASRAKLIPSRWQGAVEWLIEFVRDNIVYQVMGELRGHFRPEFLNRVDDIVLFKPLGERQIERIVELQFDELRRRLAERRISVELTETARELIAHQGYDPVYGARPLRRYISHEVETMVGRALLRGDVQDGATVRVDAEHGELVVTYDQPEGLKGARAA